MRPTCLIVALLLAAGLASRALASEKSVVILTRVLEHEVDTAMVSCAAGREDGISVGDPAGMIDEQGLLCVGTVFFVTDRECVARCSACASLLSSGRSASILRLTEISRLREELPEGVTISGEISRIPPGRRVAWMNRGRRSGLLSEDSILVRRAGLPIARGRLDFVDAETALMELRPLVSNVRAESGDRVEFWPQAWARRQSRVNTTVLGVSRREEGLTLTLAGTAADGLTDGAMADVYRGSVYVGVASISSVYDALGIAEARWIEAASPDVPQLGDTVMVRLRSATGKSPLSAAVFRIEGDYCLIAAGETDGVKVGERFVIRRRDGRSGETPHNVAELTISTVKIDYAGGHLHSLQGESNPVTVWDFAHRAECAPAIWRSMGVTGSAPGEGRWLAARLDADHHVVAGQVVRLHPKTGEKLVAAVVVGVNGRSVSLYVPEGWGDPADGIDALVEFHFLPSETKPAEDLPAASRATSTP